MRIVATEEKLMQDKNCSLISIRIDTDGSPEGICGVEKTYYPAKTKKYVLEATIDEMFYNLKKEVKKRLLKEEGLL